MATSLRANADGTASFLNGSGVEVLKVPASAGNNTSVATLGDTLGVGQTWQDVTASRALGTTYTNSTGKPIMVSVGSHTSAGIYQMTLIATINGVAVKFSQSSDSTGNTSVGGVVIVPNGATYNITSGYTLTYWNELR